MQSATSLDDGAPMRAEPILNRVRYSMLAYLFIHYIASIYKSAFNPIHFNLLVTENVSHV